MENKGLDELRVTAFNHLKVTAGVIRLIALCNIAFGVLMAFLTIVAWETMGLNVVVFWLLWRVVSTLGGMVAEVAKRNQHLLLWQTDVKRFIMVQAAKSSHTIMEYADGMGNQDLDPQAAKAAKAMERLGYGKIYRLPRNIRLPMRCSIAMGAAFLHCGLTLKLAPLEEAELAGIANYIWAQKGSFDLKEELATCSRRAIQRHMQGCESKKRFDLTSHALNLKPPIELVTPLPYTLAVSGVRVEIVRGDKGTQTRR